MQRKCRCCSVERAAEEAKSEKPVSSSGLAWPERRGKAETQRAEAHGHPQRPPASAHRIAVTVCGSSTFKTQVGIITQERRKLERCRYWPEGQCFLQTKSLQALLSVPALEPADRIRLTTDIAAWCQSHSQIRNHFNACSRATKRPIARQRGMGSASSASFQRSDGRLPAMSCAVRCRLSAIRLFEPAEQSIASTPS